MFSKHNISAGEFTVKYVVNVKLCSERIIVSFFVIRICIVKQAVLVTFLYNFYFRHKVCCC